MSKNPFKVGDRVYVYPARWGVVASVFGKDYGTVEVEQVKECGEVVKSYWDYNVVSFTEYDPINGGLSHDRQEPKEFPKERIDRLLKEEADAMNRASNPIESPLKPKPVWWYLQQNTLDAIGEKLQKHDELIKQLLSVVIDYKVSAQISGEHIKSSIDAANRRDRDRICYATDQKKDVDFHKEYYDIVSEILDSHDITGFSIYNETTEATNKDGSTTVPLATGRVTLSIDLFKRG